MIETEIQSFNNGDGVETFYQKTTIPFDEINVVPVYTSSLEEKKEIVKQFSLLLEHKLLPKVSGILSVAFFYCPLEYLQELQGIYKELDASELIIFDAQILLRHILEFFGKDIFASDGQSQEHTDSFLRTRKIMANLKEQGLFKIIPHNENREGDVLFIPLSPNSLLLNKHPIKSKIVVNSHFFLMEIFDLYTSFDRLGEPYGFLQIGDEVILPPLYERYGLCFMKDGSVQSQKLSVLDISITITCTAENGTEEMCELHNDLDDVVFYKRPEYEYSKRHSTLLVFSGGSIVALARNTEVAIPTAGFVIGLDRHFPPFKKIVAKFKADRNASFIIQIGPLVKTQGRLLSGFSDDYYKGKGIVYPPTVYPLDWNNDRAARILLGVRSKKKEIVIVWIEGCKIAEKNKSEGVSLEETGKLSDILELDECINLDGGGSAQIMTDGIRLLEPSDFQDDLPFDRPIGMGLGF